LYQKRRKRKRKRRKKRRKKRKRKRKRKRRRQRRRQRISNLPRSNLSLNKIKRAKISIMHQLIQTLKSLEKLIWRTS